MPTTIKLKNSVTTTNTPTSLAQGEVAINITDKKVWVGNAAGTPIQLLGAGGSASFSALTCTSLTNSGLTSGRVTYATTAGLLTDSANLTFNGTTLTAAALTSTGVATFSAGTVSAPALTTTGDTNTGIFFPAADTIAFTEGGVESMRIDSSGNVAIGNSSANHRVLVYTAGAVAGYLQVANGSTGVTSTVGARLGVQSNGNAELITDLAQIFSTGNVERMRITSGGDVQIGTTTNNGRLTVDGSTSNDQANALTVRNSSGTILFQARNNGEFYTGVAASSPYNLTTGSAANAFIAASGVLQRSTSSLKYKKDVQDATHGLAEVLQLRSVTYKGKNDGDIVFGGLIAEEVDAIGLTEFVQYAKDGSPDALAYGHMVSLLAKAIQEQQAMIEELKQEVAALKAK